MITRNINSIYDFLVNIEGLSHRFEKSKLLQSGGGNLKREKTLFLDSLEVTSNGLNREERRQKEEAGKNFLRTTIGLKREEERARKKENAVKKVSSFND